MGLARRRYTNEIVLKGSIMSKYKSDVSIGQRCAEFILSLHPEVKQACALLGIDRKRFYEWENGQCAPSVYCLQAMVYKGADANYLLTGKRKTITYD